jgi:hypothetical protein
MPILVKRGKTIPFGELPPNSIALDGYCLGPAVDPANRRYSFDHHGECLRHATTATCQQVLDALLLGLEPRGYDVYLNDLDADSVLAAWLLANPDRVDHYLVRLLVPNVGARDAHGPAYPTLFAHKVAQYCQGALDPLEESKHSGDYSNCDLSELLGVCLARTTAFFNGSTSPLLKRRPKATYSVTHQGSGWVMARGGEDAFASLYGAGHRRAVVFQAKSDGSTAYTIAKQSEFVDGFPVGPASRERSIVAILANLEPGWGGSTTIGGAPRNADGSRSRLTPEEVFAIVETVVDKHAGWHNKAQRDDVHWGMDPSSGNDGPTARKAFRDKLAS